MNSFAFFIVMVMIVGAIFVTIYSEDEGERKKKYLAEKEKVRAYQRDQAEKEKHKKDKEYKVIDKKVSEFVAIADSFTRIELIGGSVDDLDMPHAIRAIQNMLDVVVYKETELVEIKREFVCTASDANVTIPSSFKDEAAKGDLIISTRYRDAMTRLANVCDAATGDDMTTKQRLHYLEKAAELTEEAIRDIQNAHDHFVRESNTVMNMAAATATAKTGSPYDDDDDFVERHDTKIKVATATAATVVGYKAGRSFGKWLLNK